MTTQIPPNKSDTFFYAKQMHNYADSGEIIDQILPCNKKAFCEHHQEDVFQILSTNHKIIGELFHNTVKGPTVINGKSKDYNLTTNYSYGSVRVDKDILEILTRNYIKKQFTPQEGIHTIYGSNNLQSYIQHLTTMDLEKLITLSKQHNFSIPSGHNGSGEGLIFIVRKIREQGGIITTKLLPVSEHPELDKIEITVTIPRK